MSNSEQIQKDDIAPKEQSWIDSQKKFKSNIDGLSLLKSAPGIHSTIQNIEICSALPQEFLQKQEQNSKNDLEEQFQAAEFSKNLSDEEIEGYQYLDLLFSKEKNVIGDNFIAQRMKLKKNEANYFTDDYENEKLNENGDEDKYFNLDSSLRMSLDYLGEWPQQNKLQISEEPTEDKSKERSSRHDPTTKKDQTHPEERKSKKRKEIDDDSATNENLQRKKRKKSPHSSISPQKEQISGILFKKPASPSTKLASGAQITSMTSPSFKIALSPNVILVPSPSSKKNRHKDRNLQIFDQEKAEKKKQKHDKKDKIEPENDSPSPSSSNNKKRPREDNSPSKNSKKKLKPSPKTISPQSAFELATEVSAQHSIPASSSIVEAAERSRKDKKNYANAKKRLSRSKFSFYPFPTPCIVEQAQEMKNNFQKNQNSLESGLTPENNTITREILPQFRQQISNLDQFSSLLAKRIGTARQLIIQRLLNTCSTIFPFHPCGQTQNAKKRIPHEADLKQITIQNLDANKKMHELILEIMERNQGNEALQPEILPYLQISHITYFLKHGFPQELESMLPSPPTRTFFDCYSFLHVPFQKAEIEIIKREIETAKAKEKYLQGSQSNDNTNGIDWEIILPGRTELGVQNFMSDFEQFGTQFPSAIAVMPTRRIQFGPNETHQKKQQKDAADNKDSFVEKLITNNKGNIFYALESRRFLPGKRWFSPQRIQDSVWRSGQEKLHLELSNSAPMSCQNITNSFRSFSQQQDPMKYKVQVIQNEEDEDCKDKPHTPKKQDNQVEKLAIQIENMEIEEVESEEEKQAKIDDETEKMDTECSTPDATIENDDEMDEEDEKEEEQDQENDEDSLDIAEGLPELRFMDGADEFLHSIEFGYNSQEQENEKMDTGCSTPDATIENEDIYQEVEEYEFIDDFEEETRLETEEKKEIDSKSKKSKKKGSLSLARDQMTLDSFLQPRSSLTSSSTSFLKPLTRQEREKYKKSLSYTSCCKEPDVIDFPIPLIEFTGTKLAGAVSVVNENLKNSQILVGGCTGQPNSYLYKYNFDANFDTVRNPYVHRAHSGDDEVENEEEDEDDVFAMFPSLARSLNTEREKQSRMIDITCHEDTVSQMICSPNCKYIFSSSFDKKVRIFNPKNGNLKYQLGAGEPSGAPFHNQEILGILTHPTDDELFFSFGLDKKVISYRFKPTAKSYYVKGNDYPPSIPQKPKKALMPPGECKFKIQEHNLGNLNYFLDLKFVSSSSNLVIGQTNYDDKKGEVILFDIEKNKIVKEFPMNVNCVTDEFVTSGSPSGSGNVHLLLDRNGIVRKFDQRMKMEMFLRTELKDTEEIAISGSGNSPGSFGNGNYFTIQTESGRIFLYDARKCTSGASASKSIRFFDHALSSHHANEDPGQAVFSGNLLATSGPDGVVKVWKSDFSQEVFQHKMHHNGVFLLKFLNFGSILASGDDDGKVFLSRIGI